MQVATTAGSTCANALRQATSEVEAAMPGIMRSFNAQDMLVVGDFWYFMGDAAAEAMQYGHKEVVCNYVVPPYVAGQPVLDAWVSYVNDYFVKALGNSPQGYDQTTMLNTSLANPNANGRSWWWYKCTELGFWQVAPAKNSIRSQKVNAQYHQDLCKNLFGITSPPDVSHINTILGGNTTGVQNTIWTNGAADPWQKAGVVKSLGPDRQAIVVDCVNETCAHCQTLYTPSPDDPLPLVKARQVVSDSI